MANTLRVSAKQLKKSSERAQRRAIKAPLATFRASGDGLKLAFTAKAVNAMRKPKSVVRSLMGVFGLKPKDVKALVQDTHYPSADVSGA